MFVLIVVQKCRNAAARAITGTFMSGNARNKKNAAIDGSVGVVKVHSVLSPVKLLYQL